MTSFCVCYATSDFVTTRLHAFRIGDGSIRDENHVKEIVDVFCRGNEDAIMKEAPGPGETILFDITMGVKNTRHGGSAYCNWKYQRHPECPNNVAEAGMSIWSQIKHLLRQARNEKRKEERDMGKCGGKKSGGKCGGGKCGK